MRSHHEINNHQIDVISIIDIKQMAMTQGRNIIEGEHTFNHQPVYKISGDNGLYTLKELQKLLLH